LALKSFRPQPLIVENVPDWVFEENSIPKGGDRWDEYSLLPEREKDVDVILKTLEKDLKVGLTPEEADKQGRARVSLDEALGDVEPHTGLAQPPSRSASSIDRTDVTTGSDRPSCYPSSPSVRSSADTTASAPYDLPNWF
jgi:hypothetical protein